MGEERRREHWLVLRAQVGDRAALNDLLSATQGWLHAYLRRLLGDPHSADDLLQAVFLLVVRKLRFLSEPRAYRSWVYRVASREAFRALKKKRTSFRAMGSQAGDAEVPDPTSISQTDAEPPAWLAPRIDQLGPNTRAVVVLHYYEGLSLREVADVLGLPEGTAKSRLASGLASLRSDAPQGEGG